jgi:hypothetical protein
MALPNSGKLKTCCGACASNAPQQDLPASPIAHCGRLYPFGNILIDGLAGQLSDEQRKYVAIMLETLRQFAWCWTAHSTGLRTGWRLTNAHFRRNDVGTRHGWVGSTQIRRRNLHVAGSCFPGKPILAGKQSCVGIGGRTCCRQEQWLGSRTSRRWVWPQDQ